MGYVYTSIAKLRAPDEHAADDVPAELSFILGQLDTAIVVQAATTGDRDSLYAAAPSGTLCLVRAPGPPSVLTGLFVKTSDPGTAVWDTVWVPTSALAFSAINLTGDYTSRSTPTYDPGVWKENAYFATCVGSVVRVDGTPIVQGSILGYLPSDKLPLRPNGDYAIATAYSGSTGPGNIKISIGADGGMTYFGPNVAWVGFDGLRYFVAS